MSQWISVKDRLPRIGDKVLVAFDNGDVACLDWNCTSVDAYREMRYWMRFPDPPPKPDAFEEWWRSHRGTLNGDDEREISGSSTPKDVARTIWYAAVAATRKEP